MVEHRRKVKVIKQIGMLSHIVRIVLSHELKTLNKFSSAHHLNLFLNLTDHILKLVVNHENSIAVLGMLNNLVTNRSS